METFVRVVCTKSSTANSAMNKRLHEHYMISSFGCTV